MNLGPLEPYRKYAKALAYAAAIAGLVSTGAMVEHWRMGKKLASKERDYYQERAKLSEEYTRTMREAAQRADTAVLEAQAVLAKARKGNAKAIEATRAAEPKDDAYACRRLPLPENYLETFR
jgi:hypothetical protein